MEPLQPRPVPGPREYALEWVVRESLAPYEVHKELLAGLEAAGGEQVAKPSPVESLLAFRQTVEGERWAGSLEAEGVPGGVRVRVRLRPRVVTEHNFWPPAELRAPLRDFAARHACFVGEQRLEPRMTDIPPEGVAAFVRDTLCNKGRALAAVVLTPGHYGTPDGAARLAADLLGVATVFRLATPAAAFELAPLVGGKERSVYGGAVRIYRPGFDPGDDPLAHDLLIPRYIDTRLLGGSSRSLAAELARRILPMAGEPIPLPAPPEEPAPARAAAHATAPPPPSATASLAGDLQRVRQESAELREEVRRLKEAFQTVLTRFEELQHLIPTTTAPGLPWPLLNPRDRELELAPSFVDQLAGVAKDGSLAAEVKKKMEAVLLEPEGYGKEMRGRRKGQRATYVARNYRLVWSVEGEAVRFVLIVSKEDPEYSPFGA